MPHQRSLEAIERRKRNRHNPFTDGVSNYGSEGLLGNARADNQLQSTITSNELKAQLDLQYGKTLENSDLPYISKILKNDKVTGRHNDQGESITKQEMIEDFGSMPAAYSFLKKAYIAN